MACPQQEDAVSNSSSGSMKRSPLTPIAVDGHRASDDPKLASSPSYPSVSRSHSDDELRQHPTLYQRRKSSVPGLTIARPLYHRRRSHNRRPSPARNSPAVSSSLTPVQPTFISGRRTSLPALHFHETVKNVVPVHIDNRTPQHRDRLSVDIYDTLQSFKFGAPPRHSTLPSANDEVDEDERQRGDRAKMRAIDDGTRRPSLPTNSSTPTAPRSQPSLSSLSSAGIVVGERQWDEHSEPDWDIVMGDITPTKTSPPPPPSNSDSVSMQSEPRRPSVPIAIPMLRRRSRSADELAVDLAQRMRGSTPTQAALSTSTPLFPWVENHHSQDYSRGNSSSPEENAYEGYDLKFILSQNTAGGDSQLKRQVSTGLLRGKFRKSKTAVQSRFEDTFMRHIMDSDPIHRQRQTEWTFRREATLRYPSDLPKTKDKDKSVDEVDCWRCEWVGKFNVHRLHGESRAGSTNSETSKGSYDRLLIVHSQDPDNKGNKFGGPRVLVHRHSRAQAFSIFRAHRLHAQKTMVSTDSVLLAVKGVLRDYTRTESTRALKTHGLTDEGRSHQSRHGSGSSGGSTHERTGQRSSSRPIHTTNDPSTSRTANHHRLTASVNSRPADRRTESELRTSSIRNVSHSSVSRPATASSVSSSRPPSVALTESSITPSFSSLSSSIEHIPSVPQWDSLLPRTPRSGTSHAQAFAMVDPDSREFDWYHRNDSGGFHSFSTTRITASHTPPLPPPATPSPPHNQRSAFGLLKRAFGSKQQQQQKEPASPVTDDGEDEPKTAIHDGKFAPPWLTVARRSDKEQHERMIRTLNDSFESVGLIPPQEKKKTSKSRSHKESKSEESVLDDVPDDSMCMLLPLWPEETDSGTQSRYHGLSRHSSKTAQHSTTHSLGHAIASTAVPLQDRRFLLVYYCHHLKDDPVADNGGSNNKKRRRPHTAGERPHTSHTRPSAVPGPFFAAGRLLTYDNVRSSGVRLPEKGLSVNGPIAEAAMAVPVPSLLPSSSDGFEVIAFCQDKGTGVSLIHEGLVKLGLVDPQDNNETAKLSEVGRAIVEMVWCGCISLMSIMP